MNKTQIIKIRISILDEKLIQINSAKAGLSLSQFMIDCALHRVIMPSPSEERATAYIELTKFHRNFTYISNLIKNRNDPEMLRQIGILINELSQHLNDIKNGK